MNILNLFRARSPLFTTVLKEYFTHKARGLKDSTLEKHRCFFNNIERFLTENKLQNIQIHEVKVKHMEQMRQWLLDNIKSCRKGRSCTIEHASRHIEHCQEAFDYAVMMEYYTHNAIDVIKCQRDKPKEPQSLTATDIAKLQNSKFSSTKYKLSVDLLLFQCFTGLNYMDLWLYQITHDTITIEGKQESISWISSPLGRGKNNKPYSVQLNKYAKAIHDKYNGEFPHITNQGLNKILKKIAFALNIDKEVSSGIGRKTYATLRYDQGMSVDGICDELGNTPTVLKKHYIMRGKNRIKNEISKLKDIPLIPEKKKEIAVIL